MKLLEWIDVDIIGSSLLPKIGLEGLAAKKIPPVAKKKSSDNDQKRILPGLSLKGGEKDKDDPPASSDLRQTILGVLNESKNDLKPLTEERDKLKKDLEVAKSDVAEFSKRFDLANQTQEIMAKVLAEPNAQRESLMERITQLEEANAQREGLLDKIYQLEEVAESLRSENFSLKENIDEAVKAGVENFRSQFEFTSDYENLQAFFVNFRAQQVLAEVKGLHPNLDFSAIELDYLAPEEVEDGAGQPPAQGQKILWTNLLLMGLMIGFSCYFVVRLIVIFLFE
ncbi:hypothetical protein Fot_22265 [Forsythia ovata]|uniref:Uncharacterized protein n=1 Tax=Forsythia ovata TaxID=205694 RepID=A0ABD1UX84_9LAMI